MIYGPYEIDALLKVIQSGAKEWNSLDSAEKALIYQAIANVLEIDVRDKLSKRLKKLLKSKALLGLACSQISFHSEKSENSLCA